MEFGGNEHNIGLACNFFPEGTGNHGIGGTQTTPSKICLIYSSLFVPGIRLAWPELGGYEHNMGLVRNFYSVAIARAFRWV